MRACRPSPQKKGQKAAEIDFFYFLPLRSGKRKKNMGHEKKMNDKIGQRERTRRGREKGIGRWVGVLRVEKRAQKKKEIKKKTSGEGRNASTIKTGQGIGRGRETSAEIKKKEKKTRAQPSRELPSQLARLIKYFE